MDCQLCARNFQRHHVSEDFEVGAIIPISQVRRLRLKEVKWDVPGQMAGKQQNPFSAPVLLGSKAVPYGALCHPNALLILSPKYVHLLSTSLCTHG